MQSYSMNVLVKLNPKYAQVLERGYEITAMGRNLSSAFKKAKAKLQKQMGLSYKSAKLISSYVIGYY